MSLREDLIRSTPKPNFINEGIRALGPDEEILQQQGTVGWMGLRIMKGLRQQYFESLRMLPTGFASTDGLVQSCMATPVLRGKGITKGSKVTYDATRFAQKNKDAAPLSRIVAEYLKQEDKVMFHIPDEPSLGYARVPTEDLYPTEGEQVQVAMGDYTVKPGVLTGNPDIIDFFNEILGKYGKRMDDLDIVVPDISLPAFESDTLNSPFAGTTLWSDGASNHFTLSSTREGISRLVQDQLPPDYPEIPVECFRPDAELDGFKPLTEILVQQFQIDPSNDDSSDPITLHSGSLTPRCRVPSLDPSTGEQSLSAVIKGISQNLPRIDRRGRNLASFGVNVDSDVTEEGRIISRGDVVRITRLRTAMEDLFIKN